ncbi:MAG: UvrB/UvrC motif-containing protein, partial [Clostridium perfringens]|nr:UvrB/UvrC motif-containing protein [Clostridium perfringens]
EVKKAAKKDIPIEKLIEQYEEEMKEAAKNLQFERAAELRDIIKDLKENSK